LLRSNNISQNHIEAAVLPLPIAEKLYARLLASINFITLS